jgi:hypothetical protein
MLEPKKLSRLSQQAGWRMIASTAFAAVVCWLAALAMLRGVVAQNAEPAGQVNTPATQVDTKQVDTNEEEVVSRRVLPSSSRESESPEFRDSADNNVSFPVDI